jgi:hypothetical protein
MEGYLKIFPNNFTMNNVISMLYIPYFTETLTVFI